MVKLKILWKSSRASVITTELAYKPDTVLHRSSMKGLAAERYSKSHLRESRAKLFSSIGLETHNRLSKMDPGTASRFSGISIALNDLSSPPAQYQAPACASVAQLDGLSQRGTQDG
jgi:hypothetical protein